MTRIAFSTSAKEAIEALQSRKDKQARTLLAAIDKKLAHIKENTTYGQPVAKRLVPKRYAQEGYKTIFRVELPAYWRMLYTMRREETIEILVIILDIVDHKEYDRLFGYRKK